MMTTVLNFFASLVVIFTPGVEAEWAQAPSETVEIGLAEVSPNGPDGGYAIPASGCSHPGGWPHNHGFIPCDDPEITADPPVVRYGDTTLISWDPGDYFNCVLGGPVTGNANVEDSNDSDPLFSETEFTISCGLFDNVSDDALVRVLPQLEET